MTPAEILERAMEDFDPPWYGRAQAAIIALDKEGFVIVPKAPTDEMAVAGIKVCEGAMTTNEPQTAVIYGQPKEIYQAMIEAWTHD